MSEFSELPFEGDPDPAGEQDVPEEDYLTAEDAEADETVDINEADEDE